MDAQIFLCLAIFATLMFIYRLDTTILIHKIGEGTVKVHDIYLWMLLTALFWTGFYIFM